MSKIKKLIKTPHLFFRDFLLKKYPVNFPRIESVGESQRIEVARCNFPIDLVYTWVDSNDEAFKKELSRYIGNDDSLDKSAKSPARWLNHDELKYSLRSIEKFAPWFNKIYIVTNGQKPAWLNEGDKIKIISHDEILEKDFLPTFNSHVIGSALHKIPGLSENYVYFNDDIFLLKSMSPEDFFTPSGLAYSFISDNEIDNGPPSVYDIPTVVAAKNSRKLINQHTGYYFSRRMAHMYHPQLKSVANLCEEKFSSEYKEFRINKFRHPRDQLCASYLHPYMGYMGGKVIFKKVRGWYVKIREKSSLDIYEKIIKSSDKNTGRPVLCANDYIPPNFDFYEYGQSFDNFLNVLFPNPSKFEK